MSLLRVSTSSSLARAIKAPSVAMAARGYADGPNSGAGATASSKSFGTREKAEESQYVQKAEKEKLQKLRESIKKQKSELDELTNKLDDLEKK